MLNIKQLIAFVGVYEERSFSKAAKRLNATQSGLSMLTQQLEQRVNLKLFDRSPRGVVPTFAGHRLYTLGVDLIRRLDEADSEIRALSSGISGDIRVGLMPTFTRGVLAPALADFMTDHRNVKVSIFEAYSAVLTDGVANGEFDFAIVPRAAPRDGIRTHLLGSDREILVCRPNPGLRHLAPVRLADLPPLKLVLPAKGNARRDAFDTYAELHSLRIATILNMDAMIATLEFVTHSDFVTILPETICVNDFDGKVRSLHPIVGPVLTVDYAVIEPSKSAMHPAAQLFLKRLEIQYRKLNEIWSRVAEGQAP